MKKLIAVFAIIAGSVFVAIPAALATDAPPPTDPSLTTGDPAPAAGDPAPVVEDPPPPVVEDPPPVVEDPPAPVVDDPALVASNSTAKKSAKSVKIQTPAPKQVVVCKFVTTPGGVVFNVIIVSAESLDGFGFDGKFPFTFGDAQDSIAIRYAADGELAKDIDVSECTNPVPPPEETGKRVVICKFVGTPPGVLDHIIIVDESALGDGFDGTFPYPFPDAQDSFAIRFATDGEQAKDVSLTECLPPPPPPKDACPNIAGDQSEGTDCTPPGHEPTEEEEAPQALAVLPDTGGAPLWVLLLGGAMTASGVLLFRGARRPVAIDGSWGGGDASFALALPPKLAGSKIMAAPARAVVSSQAKSEWLMLAGGVVAAVAAVFFGSRLR